MKKIRINDFYSKIDYNDEVSDKEIEIIENNLSNIKEISLSNETNSLKIKCFISKIIMYLLELIDILLVFSIIFMDNINILVISVFILNIIVGIVFVITPDYKEELDNKERVIF